MVQIALEQDGNAVIEENSRSLRETLVVLAGDAMRRIEIIVRQTRTSVALTTCFLVLCGTLLFPNLGMAGTIATPTVSPTNTGTPVPTATHTPTSTMTLTRTSTISPSSFPTSTQTPFETGTTTPTGTHTSSPTLHEYIFLPMIVK